MTSCWVVGGALVVGTAVLGAYGASSPDRHQVAVPAGEPVRTVSQAKAYDGVGASVEPADVSVRPKVSAARARALLATGGLATDLVGRREPTTLLLVQYENVFGTMQPNGKEIPSVPRQVAWFAEWDGLRSSGISRPSGSGPTKPGGWVCSYYIALSADTGKTLDGFDICH